MESTFPHAIIIDTAEGQPYRFTGIRCNKTGNELSVPLLHKSLGRHPLSLGDYSIDCGLGQCHVERKSIQDAHSTFLGWQRADEPTGRRDRFTQELANLSEIPSGLVVVECSFDDLIRNAPETPKRTAKQNAKTLARTILSWQQDFKVRWLFCDGRRMAEVMTFRFLERFAKKFDEAARKEERKKRDKQLKEAAKILLEI